MNKNPSYFITTISSGFNGVLIVSVQFFTPQITSAEKAHVRVCPHCKKHVNIITRFGPTPNFYDEETGLYFISELIKARMIDLEEVQELTDQLNKIDYAPLIEEGARMLADIIMRDK